MIWPLLLARVDLEAELVLRMEKQHEEVAAGLEAVAALLPEWERTASPAAGEAIAVAIEQHRAALVEHLTDEENHLLSLIEEHLTVAEWEKLGERFAEETPKDKLLFFLGALLEEATAEETADHDAQPAHPGQADLAARGQASVRPPHPPAARAAHRLTCRLRPSINMSRPKSKRWSPSPPTSALACAFRCGKRSAGSSS